MSFKVEITVTPDNKVGRLVAGRIGPVTGYDDEHEYVIMRPPLFKGVTFRHRYSDSWLVFLQKITQAVFDSGRDKRLPKPPVPKSLDCRSFTQQLDDELIEHIRECTRPSRKKNGEVA